MQTKKQLRRFVVVTAVFIFAAFLILILFGFYSHETHPRVGVTFSTQYARYLGLDPVQVFDATTNDFELDAIRIPVYWDEIEPSQGQFQFDLLDGLMDRANQEDIDVTLVVGMKVPRWPECFIPDWNKEREESFEADFLHMVQTVVERYREHPALARWQVENEPFFPFGDCPMPDPDRFEQTVRFVRLLDPQHLIQSTTSGEQSLWFLRTGKIDVLGVSLYREVWNKTLGAFVFPHSPMVYTLQRILAEPFVDEVIISELQMEPWIPEDLANVDASTDELYALFPIEDMDANMAFARQIGVTEIDLWGVEWWYYLKAHGEERLWQWAQSYFQTYETNE